MKTYRYGALAHRLGGGYALLPDDFNLQKDYDNPKSHKVLCVSNTCAGVSDAAINNYRAIRVMIDHDATGTGTTGTGDTYVRSV